MTGQQHSSLLQPPLRPRNGHTLRVLLPGRVSDPRPGKQDLRSLDDQQDIQRRWLERHVNVPVDIIPLAGSGSGERIERAEYQKLLELVESEQYDLVLTEDLGRIVRRVYAFHVCELCEDHGVRLISINNHGVDTARLGWRDAAFFASYFYEKENQDKSLRIKERLRARFLAGGALPNIIFGYVKPTGTKTDDDLRKDPVAETILKEWFRRLDEDNASYSEIADWLNTQSVPTSQSCRKPKWDCHLVSQITHNPILKGIRYHNKRKSRRINISGRYKTEKAPPEDLLERHVPHLAFFDSEYYDRVLAKLDARNAKYRRAGRGEADPCQNRPKKRVRFPGQALYCNICGRLYVFGGHGQKDHLVCSGAREYRCWNSITADGPLTARNISEAVFAEIEALEDFDPAFRALVEAETRRLETAQAKELRENTRELSRVERELSNLVAFIRRGDHSDVIREELARLEHERKRLQCTIASPQEERPPLRVLPTAEEIKQLAGKAFRDLARESYEFCRQLRDLTGRIFVCPYRPCDGGQIVLRAKFRLRLSGLLPDKWLGEALRRPLELDMTVDLFEPPQRIAFREEILARRRDQTEEEAARDLGITKTAAQRAAALDRRMQQLGLSDPYVPLTEPPPDSRKMIRHLHPRYRFEPLEGHEAL